MKRNHAVWREFKKNKTLTFMIAPALLFFFVFSYIPMIGIYYAFTRYNHTGGLFGSPFIGLTNFEFLVKSGTLLNITKNTILYNAVFILLENILSIAVSVTISVLVGRAVKRIMQSILFLPYFISFVILGVFVYNLFSYEYGFVNTFLKSVNMEPIDVYNTPVYWIFILPIFYVWKNIGYGTVIYLATITSISQEFYEAAEIDGASTMQQIFRITIPQLKPTFVILILFSLGRIMRGQFDMFYNMVGQNGKLFNTTDIIDTYVYRSMVSNFDIGLASAAGLYQSVFGFLLILTVNAIINKVAPEHALF